MTYSIVQVKELTTIWAKEADQMRTLEAMQYLIDSVRETELDFFYVIEDQTCKVVKMLTLAAVKGIHKRNFRERMGA